MKSILSILTLAFISVFAFSQNIPAGVRMEIVEIEQNDNEFSIFTYKDEGGTPAYYLSLCRNTDILGLISDSSETSFGIFSETCLLMGETAEEALAFLDSLLELCDEAVGTNAEFAGRKTFGGEKLGEPTTATAVVTKRFLQSKRLCFYFTSGKRSSEADLKKSTIKMLRMNLKLDRKLHPSD